MSTNDEQEDPSYIDYETFLDPDFSSSTFANSLVLATNNSNDAQLDLSTPLSRVLFDIQEIDSHIDLLTTRSAVPLLTHTKEQAEASGRIVTDIDTQVQSLNDSYKQLEKEVIKKHAEADEVRQVALRLWETLRIGRSLARCLDLGRRLELQYADVSGSEAKKDDQRSLVGCAETILSLRELLEQCGPEDEGRDLDKLDAIRTLRSSVISPIEKSIRETAERIIREFSMGSVAGSATFAQSEDTRRRTVSALETLYLISPTALAKGEKWTPSIMLHALDTYLRSALQSSIASLARSLATLPTLERTLAEISARCQNIIGLELVLESTRSPSHPFRHLLVNSSGISENGNLLQPLLAHLETGSLASYFWRTVAGSMSTRVMEIMNRGGVSARTLRTNKASVGDAIRECVVKGSQPPSAMASGAKGRSKVAEVKKAGVWDREVAVMVGSVIGHLGR